MGVPFQKQLVKRCVCVRVCVSTGGFMSTSTEKLPIPIFSIKRAELSFAFCLSTCLKHKVLILNWTPKAGTGVGSAFTRFRFRWVCRKPSSSRCCHLRVLTLTQPPTSPRGSFWGKDWEALKSLKEGEDNYQKSSPFYKCQMKSRNKMSGL